MLFPSSHDRSHHDKAAENLRLSNLNFKLNVQSKPDSESHWLGTCHWPDTGRPGSQAFKATPQGIRSRANATSGKVGFELTVKPEGPHPALCSKFFSPVTERRIFQSSESWRARPAKKPASSDDDRWRQWSGLSRSWVVVVDGSSFDRTRAPGSNEMPVSTFPA